MLKPIAIATADLRHARHPVRDDPDALRSARQIPDMLRYVASGPFPAATDMGAAGAVLGLVVHFTLMAIMAAVFMWLVRQRPVLLDTARSSPASLYGLITYVVMNWLVVPLRFGTPLPPKPLGDRHPAVRAHRPGRHPDSR